MTDDVRQLLKDSGYLASPADRYFWKNATPTFRNHVRQMALLGLSTALPAALLFASLSLMSGWDRWVLFLFYAVAVLMLLIAGDLVIGLIVPWKRLERWWPKTRILAFLPMVLAALLLFFLSQWLDSLIALRSFWARILLWTALGATAWIAAKTFQLLVITRLYWHGIKPPPRHPYPWLMILVLVSVGGYQANKHLSSTPELPEMAKVAPTLLLTLDVPEPWFSHYLESLPDWPRQTFSVSGTDITNFWTEWATGASAEVHQTSLVVFDTPFFKNGLNRRDPVQRLPLWMSSKIGLSSPKTGGGRYRKFFWEILDGRGARVFSYAFWHSYPASSQNGGVLSERWTSQEADPPFQVGLNLIEEEDPVPFAVEGNAQATAERENQSWQQLRQRVESADFDLCIAYFPLSDQLQSLNPDEWQRRQADLLAFRLGKIQNLLSRLPRDSRVGIQIASGKTQDGEPIQSVLISNWLADTADPLTSHLEFAPTVLNQYQLPAGRLMAASRSKLPLDFPLQRVDYGEPERNRAPDPRTDQHYYEELKSLGYVQ